MIFKNLKIIIICYLTILSFSHAQNNEKYKDYFHEGQEQAKKDYFSNYGIGHFVAGTLSGLAVPPLGTIYGYIYTWVYAKPVVVPSKYVSSLNEKNKKEFKEGYLEYIRKNKLSKFNAGIKCGCATYILAYAAIYPLI